MWTLQRVKQREWRCTVMTKQREGIRQRSSTQIHHITLRSRGLLSFLSVDSHENRANYTKTINV